MRSVNTMLAAAFLVSGCLATLPAPVLTSDSQIFDGDKNVYEEAKACAEHLTTLRNNAKWSSLLRLLLTIASGTTTSISGYVAATKSDSAPDKAKTAAQIALVSGVIGVLTQAIPEPNDALERHRDASSSWIEARRRVYNSTNPKDVQFLLQACRNNQPFMPVPRGATEPLADTDRSRQLLEEISQDLHKALGSLPSRSVAIAADSSIDLSRAADCLMRGDVACVNAAVDIVLNTTAGAAKAIEERAQALAIRATSRLYEGRWELAAEDYREALRIHIDSTDSHKPTWHGGRAAALANRGAELKAAGQSAAAAQVWEEAWAEAAQAGMGSYPTRVGYDKMSIWLTMRALGTSDATPEIRDGELGIRLTCDKGQRILGHTFGNRIAGNSRARLQWHWYADEIPVAGDARVPAISDQGVQVMVVFEGPKVLHYLWDGKAPVNWSTKRPDSGMPLLEIMELVIETGTGNLRQDLSYDRDLAADYQLFYPGATLPPIVGVALQTQCFDTQSSASGWISPLLFSTGAGPQGTSPPAVRPIVIESGPPPAPVQPGATELPATPQ